LSHGQQDVQQVTSTQIYTTFANKTPQILYKQHNTTQHKSPLHINSSSAHQQQCAVWYLHYYHYWYSALGPVWAETKVQSGDWYGSGTLHPGQILRGSLPLLSPAFFRCSHFSPPGASTSATT